MNKGAMTAATVYRNNDREEFLSAGRKWQGIPGIERTKGGRLYACWYSGGKTEQPGNVIIIEKSDDDGATWTDGFALVQHDDPEVRCFDPTLWIDPMGRLWAFWTQSWQYYDGRDGVWAAVVSEPDAENVVFETPRRLADGLMMNKPIVTKDGKWVMPSALWSCGYFEAREEHPELDDKRLANVYVSEDAGKTFEWRGGVDMPDRAFDEHMVVELEGGRLWMLVRTTYGIGQAFSSDGGHSWQEIGPSGHTGPNSRFFITRLKSGNLLMINHINPTYSMGEGKYKTRNNLMAMLSEDDGKTWHGGLMLDSRDQVSYPDGTQAEDGRIYIIYDWQRYKAREVLMSVFTEEDVLAGRPVSGKARFEILVNKATGEID